MKCIVIYFSQTGNTEKVAKAIQKGVQQTAGHCDIVKIKDANPRRLYEYDLIGLGAPCFAVEPGNVKIFINNMRFVGGKHGFAFSTHGTMPVYFFPSIVPRLKRRGLIVIGTGDWYGNCSLYHHMEPYPTAGHPDEIDLKEAEDFGREMVERSRRIATGETQLIPPVPPPNPTRTPPLKDFKAGLKFHKEKCLYPECRLCMDNCPMDGIDLTVKPPVIAQPCIVCEWCARICPTGALDILDWLEAGDQEEYVSMMKSENLPLLAEAEAEGRFRWLIPKDAITFTKSYKLHKKHPQWVIGEGLQPPDSYPE